jgi:lysophospholipase L1-like esterase
MLNGYRHKSPPMVYDHPWVAENFEHTLRAYMDFLRENSCKIIFVRYGDNGIDDQLSKYIRRLRDRAASIAAEKGVVICDLVPQIERYPKRKDLYNESGFHVTKDGADLVASELAKAILNLSDKNAR